MCRLLSYVCATPETPAGRLGDLLAAFTALSAHHRDGWGMAWCADAGVHSVREPVPAMSSAEYRSAVESIDSDAVMLHLRRASPGLPVTEANCHPFQRDGFAFAHNGFVGSDWQAALSADLQPEGTTDSERYFLAVLRMIRSTGDVTQALADGARRALQAPETSSANAMLLTDTALHVVCAYRPGREPIGSAPDHFDLRYRADADGVVVAPAELVPDGWDLLPNRSVLTIARKTLEADVIGF